MNARQLILPAALLGLVAMAGCASRGPVPQLEPIVIGQAFVMNSVELKEQRRITVFLPPGYADSDRRYPVLYLLDGGAAEDFHHVTGIVQVSIANAIMEPIIVIGIENTERRRDLTGPTQKAEDKAIAPRVGGSAAFRAFLKNELVPRVEREFRGNGDRGIIGESLAGLFIVETFFEEPKLFNRYIAASPSLWWNDALLLRQAEQRLKGLSAEGKTLYLTVGGIEDSTEETNRLAEIVRTQTPAGLTLYYEPQPAEAHNTIFHIGAVNALRKLYPKRVDTAVKPSQ